MNKDFENGGIELNPDERVDDLGRKGYRIIQNKKKFCFGVDATFLAWFSKVNQGERVMDLCTGTGIVPILMDARNGAGTYVGLDIQEDMIEMAKRSVALNHIEDHMDMVFGDLKEASKIFGKGSFDVVTVNPPYMRGGSGLLNPESTKAIARHEILCTLEDVIRESALLLKPQGRFYMVHRPMRLAGIFRRMKENKLQPGRIQFIHSNEEKEASMVLIAGTKCGNDMLKTEPPIIIYDAEGNYTKKVLKIYNEE